MSQTYFKLEYITKEHICFIHLYICIHTYVTRNIQNTTASPIQLTRE